MSHSSDFPSVYTYMFSVYTHSLIEYPITIVVHFMCHHEATFFGHCDGTGSGELLETLQIYMFSIYTTIIPTSMYVYINIFNCTHTIEILILLYAVYILMCRIFRSFYTALVYILYSIYIYIYIASKRQQR